MDEGGYFLALREAAQRARCAAAMRSRASGLMAAATTLADGFGSLGSGSGAGGGGGAIGTAAAGFGPAGALRGGDALASLGTHVCGGHRRACREDGLLS